MIVIVKGGTHPQTESLLGRVHKAQGAHWCSNVPVFRPVGFQKNKPTTTQHMIINCVPGVLISERLPRLE